MKMEIILSTPASKRNIQVIKKLFVYHDFGVENMCQNSGFVDNERQICKGRFRTNKDSLNLSHTF